MSTPNGIPWSSTPDEFDDHWEGQTDAIPDILATMFAQQAQHMQAYAQINEGAQLSPHLRGDLDSARTQAAIREFASYTVEELYEAIGNLKNKPWKQTHQPTDKSAFMEEMADTWHFFIELHILAGITPLDVFEMYFQKSLINQQRQQTGY